MRVRWNCFRQVCTLRLTFRSINSALRQQLFGGARPKTSKVGAITKAQKAQSF